MRFFAALAILLAVVMVALPSASYARDKQYNAKQINLKVDGVLNEWGDSEVMLLDQLKDAGDALPDPNDFSGTGMVGWNSSDPSRLYFAVTITDSELQDIYPFDDNYWNDDSMEFMFDFANDGNLIQWNVSADGEELSSTATADNTEWVVVNSGNQYIFEVAIDPGKGGQTFSAEVGKLIGLCIHYNDSENGAREHQIGWVAGGAWDALSFGDLILDAAVVAAVGPSGKLATTWGNLRSH